MAVGSQVDALGWTFDLNILEQFYLCIANAQRNSYTREAYFESCADTLQQALHISDDARSTCLVCVHTTAVENVLQQDRDQTNALVTSSTTEDMYKLPLPVDKASFTFKAVSKMNFTEGEQKYIFDRAALNAVDDDGDRDAPLSDLIWPLSSDSQLRRSAVDNCITKVWVIDFQRKGGDIYSMYSVVVPGTFGLITNITFLF